MLTATDRLRDFPALAGQAYLNTAAESIPPTVVHEAVQEYVRDKCEGMNGRVSHFRRYDACREVASRMIGLTPAEVAFCSCSSEAYNLLATAIDPGAGDEIVVSDLDFPAGVTPWMLSGRGCAMRVWRARDGVADISDLENLLTSRTRLVQVSLVSFWNGHRLDWEAVREAVRRRAPDAVLSVDVTQALGRVVPLCPGADVIISSTHKWALGIHGGCVVGVAEDCAERLVPKAGGWHHLENAFATDRFETAVMKRGAAAFAVGMPNFAAIYALEAGLSSLERIGVGAVAAHADPLVTMVYEGLLSLGFQPMCPLVPGRMSGIVAFRHADSDQLHALLERERIRVMHQSGRIRIAVHGYNTADDVAMLLEALRRWRGSSPHPIPPIR